MKKNKHLKSFLSFLFLVILTGLVLYFSLKDHFEEIVNQLLHMNLIWVCVAIFFIFVYWILKSYAMYLFAVQFESTYTTKKSFRMTLITQFFHAVTPFNSGGQPYEIYSLTKEGLSFTDSTNVSIQGFIVYQIALVLLGVCALGANLFFHFFDHISLLRRLVVLGFTINVAVIIGLFLFAFARRFNEFIVDKVIVFLHTLKLVKNVESTTEKWNHRINEFHNGAKILMKNKAIFLKTIGLNFLALIILYLIPLVLLFGLGDYHSLNVFTSVVTCAYVMLVGSFVPLPGGTGGLEYAFVQFFGVFLSGGVLSALMLLWRFITYYFSMLVGAIVLNTKGDKK